MHSEPVGRRGNKALIFNTDSDQNEEKENSLPDCVLAECVLRCRRPPELAQPPVRWSLESLEHSRLVVVVELRPRQQLALLLERLVVLLLPLLSLFDRSVVVVVDWKVCC